MDEIKETVFALDNTAKHEAFPCCDPCHDHKSPILHKFTMNYREHKVVIVQGVASVGLLAILFYGLANVAFLGDAESGLEGTKRIAMSLMIVALFAIRDSLFLQWCQFHRFKQPLVPAGLCIGVYYVVVSALPKSVQNHLYLTPFWSMASDHVGYEPFTVSLLLLGASIVILVYAIRSRLNEKSTGPAAV